MTRIQALYSSTIGKKFIAAVTGLILFGFILGHVSGNLKAFTGSGENLVPHIDEYGQFLRVVGVPLLPAQFALWTARIVLLISLILHMTVVIQLAMLSAEARPINYVRSKKRSATLPALWMMFSGLLILGFIIFHILHFTTGTIPLNSDFRHGYVYSNLFQSFSMWPVALAYVAAMIVLGFHLYHGVWSLFQTLGIDNPDRNRFLRMLATGLTIAIVLGFIAVPIGFFSGMMPEPVIYSPELLGGH